MEKSGVLCMVTLGLPNHPNKKRLGEKSIQIFLILCRMTCVIFAGHVFVIANY